MFRLKAGILVLAVTLAQAGAAQTGNDNSGKNPFKLNIGPQADGGFGLSVKGQDIRRLFGGQRHVAFALYGADGAFNLDADKRDNVEVFLKPGVVVFGGSGLDYDLAVTGDVVQRFGELKTTSGSIDEVNQTIVGATLIWIPRPFQRWVEPPLASGDPADCWFLGTCTAKPIATDAPPSVTLSYYHPVDHSSNVAALPEGITATKLVGRLKGDLLILRSARWQKLPIRFVFDFSGTYATAGDAGVEFKTDVGIGVRLKNKFTPLLQYVSGEEAGFKYDRQLFLGLLWRLTE